MNKPETLILLDHVFDICGVDRWDGGNAKALSLAAYEHAKSFIRDLPDQFPMPDIAATEKGDVNMLWMGGEKHHLSIDIDDYSVIYYSLISKGQRIHNNVLFTGSIPEEITDALEQLYDNEIYVEEEI
jgi:hypothetical protein